MFCKIRRIGKRFENGRFPREARITGGSLSRNTKHDEDSLITQTQPRAETQYSNYAHVAVESRTQTAQTGRASWPKGNTTSINKEFERLPLPQRYNAACLTAKLTALTCADRVSAVSA